MVQASPAGGLPQLWVAPAKVKPTIDGRLDEAGECCRQALEQQPELVQALGEAQLAAGRPGDARETLPTWEGRADAWFLDGFSPAKNPELWGADLMTEVARHTAPRGTVATYTAAGFVRRGLQAAGFTVERVPGFGRKRHMTRAQLA